MKRYIVTHISKVPYENLRTVQYTFENYHNAYEKAFTIHKNDEFEIGGEHCKTCSSK